LVGARGSRETEWHNDVFKCAILCTKGGLLDIGSTNLLPSRI